MEDKVHKTFHKCLQDILSNEGPLEFGEFAENQNIEIRPYSYLLCIIR